MTDLIALKTAQAAAFAAWKSCPDKSLVEKARLAAELDAATKAVAAAKKAAEPTTTTPTITVEQALSGQKDRTSHEKKHGWYKDFADKAETAYRLGQPEWGQ